MAKIAKQLVDGTIFTDRHCRSRREIENSFMLLALMDKKQRDHLMFMLGKHGMVYEEMHKAMPTAINGQPCFFSCHVLTSSETTIVWEKYKRLKKLIDNELAG